MRGDVGASVESKWKVTKLLEALRSVSLHNTLENAFQTLIVSLRHGMWDSVVPVHNPCRNFLLGGRFIASHWPFPRLALFTIGGEI